MSTWIPEANRDTAWPIWHKLFMCRVRMIDTLSADYIKHFGMPATGIAEYDTEIPKEAVIRMLTINQMVEFYKKGVNVSVVNLKDTKIIYDFITDHLLAWKDKLNNSFGNRGAPLDDLILLKLT